MQSRHLQLPIDRKPHSQNYQQRFYWADTRANYEHLEDHEIQQQNKRILTSLRQLNQQVTMELGRSLQKISKNPSVNPSAESSLNSKHIQNNITVIETLTKTLKTQRIRKEQLLAGREEQTTEQKYQVRQEINKRRNELKELKLEMKELEKQLVQNETRQVPYCRELIDKMQDELKVCSIKYTGYLKRLKLSEQQLSTVIPGSPITLSTNIFEQLEKKQAEQYKQYLNIVKLSEVLSHRNESDTGKYSRQYGIKIRQLEQILEKVRTSEVQLASKDLEALEQKKQIQLMKLKLEQQSGNDSANRVMRRHSQSVKNIVAHVYYQKGTDLQDISQVRKSTSKLGSSTDRYIKKTFPTRRKATIGQNYFELQPIKNKVQKMIN